MFESAKVKKLAETIRKRLLAESVDDFAHLDSAAREKPVLASFVGDPLDNAITKYAKSLDTTFGDQAERILNAVRIEAIVDSVSTAINMGTVNLTQGELAEVHHR